MGWKDRGRLDEAVFLPPMLAGTCSFHYRCRPTRSVYASVPESVPQGAWGVQCLQRCPGEDVLLCWIRTGPWPTVYNNV